MGKFHPHGDQSLYDALVRMAQPFSLRLPLVDGQGNFGSLDGDPAAAMRYTECRLRPIAEELLDEIKKRTVDFRPNYDGQRFEPVVLPAQFPQLLVNGCEGIAVGMATRIPPHNLGEVVDACIALSRDRSLTTEELVQLVRGPDFPTGGQIIATEDDLVGIYDTGQGTVRVRATWHLEKEGRRRRIILTSIPYGQNKAKILERVGTEVAAKRLPQVVDVRDESTEDVRIVLDLKNGSSPDAVMAWLFKHTPLESSWHVNLTCLIPTPGTDVATPARLGLGSILLEWLDFRFETVRRRFEYDLAQLLERIHILEGFEVVFDALDEAIALIRASEGKRDAAERLMERFDLTEPQTDAILSLRLYKLARMEIQLVREELEEKREQAEEYEYILSSDPELWSAVRKELLQLRELYRQERRTSVGPPQRELTYDTDAYIVKEDAFVVVTRDGWIKRQSSFTEIGKIRIRDEDQIGWLVKAHTRSTVTFFSSRGIAYVMRVDDVPATTGYGNPLQRHFAFADGERVVGVISHDARHRPVTQEALPLATADEPPPPWAVACTEKGRVLRFSVSAHEEPSNRSGRRYARLASGDAVLVAYPTIGTEQMCVATTLGRAMCFEVVEVPILRAAGKGVMGIKVRPNDRVMACELAQNTLQGPAVVTSRGRELVVRTRKFGITRRGGRGRVVLKRGSIDLWHRQPVLLLGVPDTPPEDEEPEGEEVS
jgi:DNA gyrase subunit A